MFDNTHRGSPFRAVTQTGCNIAIDDLWQSLDNLYLEIPWQENIGKGKLCWVWDNDYRDRVVRLIESYEKGKYYTRKRRPWNFAELLTTEEIAEYTAQNL